MSTVKNKRQRALPVAESGLHLIATQIRTVMEGADVQKLGSELDLEGYARLVTVMVRLANVAVRCENRRSAEQARKSARPGLGLGSEKLTDIEQTLKIL